MIFIVDYKKMTDKDLRDEYLTRMNLENLIFHLSKSYHEKKIVKYNERIENIIKNEPGKEIYDKIMLERSISEEIVKDDKQLAEFVKKYNGSKVDLISRLHAKEFDRKLLAKLTASLCTNDEVTVEILSYCGSGIDVEFVTEVMELVKVDREVIKRI